MSLVLYRKYRPQSLKEIVAQKPIVDTLKAALDKQTIGHALLFTGPRGIGKTSLARIVAHQINKAEYVLDDMPIDIIEIDAASNGRIDEIRNLRENIKFMPLKLKYKIYIIDEVHMLTKEAFNGLLKTLEEPPAHVIFILATTEVHKVPATIVSRCQHFAFSTIPVKELADHLKKIATKEKIKIDDKALDILAEHAQGGLRDGLSLLEQISNLNKAITSQLVEEILGLPPQKILDDLVKALINNDFVKVINIYQDLISQGTDIMVLTKQLMHSFRTSLKTESDPKIRQRLLSILEDLIEVMSARQPQINLEICLLKHSQTEVKSG